VLLTQIFIWTDSVVLSIPGARFLQRSELSLLYISIGVGALSSYALSPLDIIRTRYAIQ
jgi:hypothetical protein